MKDRCPITGEGKSCGISFNSLKSKFYKPSAKPATMVFPSGGALNKTLPTAVTSAPAASSSGSELRVIDLNNVNIGDPDF